MTILRKFGLCLWLLVLFALTARAEPQDLVSGAAVPVEVGVAVQWESRYVSEGRDNLGDGGIGSVEAVAGYRGFEAGVWYAAADTVSYDELNLFVQYGFPLGPFELYAGYTRLEFLKDADYDNELFAGVALAHVPWLIPSLSYVYSTEAQGGDGGSFVEAALVSPLELLGGDLVVELYLLEGFDFGYASDGYDGFNNFQFGVCAHYALSSALTLNGSINHSIANQDVRRDGGGDETWLTLGIGAKF